MEHLKPQPDPRGQGMNKVEQPDPGGQGMNKVESTI